MLTPMANVWARVIEQLPFKYLYEKVYQFVAEVRHMASSSQRCMMVTLWMPSAIRYRDRCRYLYSNWLHFEARKKTFRVFSCMYSHVFSCILSIPWDKMQRGARRRNGGVVEPKVGSWQSQVVDIQSIAAKNPTERNPYETWYLSADVSEMCKNNSCEQIFWY